MKLFIFVALYLGVTINGINAIIARSQTRAESLKQAADRRRNEGYNAALIMAAKDGHEHLVELLIENIANISLANINAANQFGDTPLHAAANAGHVGIVRLLIESGANSSLRNNDRKSPKDLATDQGFKEIVELLSVSHRACYLYANSPTVRILDGKPANFTWMVALGYVDPNYKISFDCGATIISDLFLLTAAHCVKDDRRPVLARIGKLSLTDNGGKADEKLYIERIIRHPGYLPSKKKNDIALIQLVKRIYFSPTVGPACLQTDPRDEDTSTKLTVSGWGKILNDARTRSDLLLRANVQTVPLSQCNETILEYNKDKNLAAYRNGISDSQYCAHDPNGRSDSCEGDSGGPLQIIQDGNRPSKVVGIISFSISCGSSFPSIYTRVASYVDWIEPFVWPNDEILPPLLNFAAQVPSPGDFEVPDLMRITQKACEVYKDAGHQLEIESTIIDLFDLPIEGQRTERTASKFPWTATLGYLNSEYKITFDCWGTIISDSFVLSAAHCVKTSRPPITVNLNDKIGDGGGAEEPTRKYLIKTILRHPDYSAVKHLNDIALIELTKRITFTTIIRPACLQTDINDEDPNVKLVVPVRRIFSSSSNELLLTEFQTVPLSECNTTVLSSPMVNTASLRNGISESQYCALQSNSSKDSAEREDCWGFSGAPLQNNHDSAPEIVVGIVSYGIACGTTMPIIFTRVAYYLDWIESIVWPNGEIPIPLKNTTTS